MRNGILYLFFLASTAVLGQNTQLSSYFSWFTYTRQDVNRNFQEDVFQLVKEKDSASFHVLNYTSINPIVSPNFSLYIGDSCIEQVVIESTDPTIHRSFSAQLKANKFRTLNADVNGNFITTSYDNEAFLVHQDYQAIDNPNGKGQIAYYQYRIHRKYGVFDALNGEKTKMLSENGVSYVGVRENFKNGLLSGERTLYYPNGTVKRKENYQAGRLNGLVSDYSSEGKLIHTSTHSYHWKYGMEKWYNNEGKMVKSLQWQRDVPVGVEKQTFNGVLVGSVSYVKGVKQGIAQIPVYAYEQMEFGEQPDTLSTEPLAIETVNFENGLKSGRAFAILFNSKDTLYVSNYKLGVLDSSYVRYGKSGIEYTTTYVNGFEDGIRTYSISSGALKDSVYRVVPYSKGKLNGKVEQRYVKNDFHALTIDAAGISLKYASNHHPKATDDGWVPNSTFVWFKNGVKDGPFQIMEDSLNYMKGAYKNGSFDESLEAVSTNSNNATKTYFYYENGLKNGEQTVVSLRRDTTIVTEIFLKGKRHGVSSRTVNGVLQEERNYASNRLKKMSSFSSNGNKRLELVTNEVPNVYTLIQTEEKGDTLITMRYAAKTTDFTPSDTVLVFLQKAIETNSGMVQRHGDFEIITPDYEKKGTYSDNQVSGYVVINHKTAGVYEQLTYEKDSITAYGYTNVSNSEVYTGTFISATSGEQISVKNGVRHGWCVQYNASKNKVSKKKYVNGVLKKTVPISND